MKFRADETERVEIRNTLLVINKLNVALLVKLVVK